MKKVICQTVELLFWLDEVIFINGIPEPNIAVWKKILSQEPIIYSSEISSDETGTVNSERVELTADREKLTAVIGFRYGFHVVLRLTDFDGNFLYVGKKDYPCKMEVSGDNNDAKVIFSAKSPI